MQVGVFRNFWWWNTEPNPRPFADPDSNAWALRAWIRRFGQNRPALPLGFLGNAIRSDDWAIPHIGLSSLGEIVCWARPDEFPPRNMRTSKGLRALGYSMRIGV